MTLTKSARAYLAEIGARGGAAGRGTPQRSALNRAAAIARWAKVKPVNKSGRKVALKAK